MRPNNPNNKLRIGGKVMSHQEFMAYLDWLKADLEQNPLRTLDEWLENG